MAQTPQQKKKQFDTVYSKQYRAEKKATETPEQAQARRKGAAERKAKYRRLKKEKQLLAEEAAAMPTPPPNAPHGYASSVERSITQLNQEEGSFLGREDELAATFGAMREKQSSDAGNAEEQRLLAEAKLELRRLEATDKLDQRRADQEAKFEMRRLEAADKLDQRRADQEDRRLKIRLEAQAASDLRRHAAAGKSQELRHAAALEDHKILQGFGDRNKSFSETKMKLVHEREMQFRKDLLEHGGGLLAAELPHAPPSPYVFKEDIAKSPSQDGNTQAANENAADAEGVGSFPSINLFNSGGVATAPTASTSPDDMHPRHDIYTIPEGSTEATNPSPFLFGKSAAKATAPAPATWAPMMFGGTAVQSGGGYVPPTGFGLAAAAKENQDPAPLFGGGGAVASGGKNQTFMYASSNNDVPFDDKFGFGATRAAASVAAASVAAASAEAANHAGSPFGGGHATGAGTPGKKRRTEETTDTTATGNIMSPPGRRTEHTQSVKRRRTSQANPSEESSNFPIDHSQFRSWQT